MGDLQQGEDLALKRVKRRRRHRDKLPGVEDGRRAERFEQLEHAGGGGVGARPVLVVAGQAGDAGGGHRSAQVALTERVHEKRHADERIQTIR